MKKVVFPTGSWKMIDAEDFVKGQLDFDKLFMRMAKRYNIPYANNCCEQDTSSRPVRYNEDTAVLEYYDSETKEWTEVPSA